MDSRDPTRRNRAWWNDCADGYQKAHDGQLSGKPLAWGVWALPEEEVEALGDVAGRDVLEFGCGAAQWSIALARQGARPVGLDLSERQLSHARRLAARAGVRVALVHANAEHTPFVDASFDIVFCDHGAVTYARPERTVAEAARILRPGGRFVFNIASPFIYLCWDEKTDRPVERMTRDYFDLGAMQDEEYTSYQLPYGEWLRLFRKHSFVVEDLIEPRPPAQAKTTYKDFAGLDWARRWPAENLWKLRKRASRSD